MPDVSKFKTAHQLANELLKMPDYPVLMPVRMFDMPGAYTAYPVRIEAATVEGVNAVTVLADGEVLKESNEPTEKRDHGNPQSQNP